MTTGEIEQIAQRTAEIVLDRLTDWELERSIEWLDAPELARRLSCSIDLVYANQQSLGVKRLGTGERPRLRFPWPQPHEPTSRPAEHEAPTRRRRRQATSDIELLPIKGTALPASGAEV
jgi:hypothetical protein